MAGQFLREKPSPLSLFALLSLKGMIIIVIAKYLCARKHKGHVCCYEATNPSIIGNGCVVKCNCLKGIDCHYTYLESNQSYFFQLHAKS